MTWHRLAPSSGDDYECSNPDCGLVVADEVLSLLAIDCPAPACTDPTNTTPCVMVATEDSLACAYCGQSGALGEGPDNDFDDTVWVDLTD